MKKGFDTKTKSEIDEQLNFLINKLGLGINKNQFILHNIFSDFSTLYLY